MLAASRLHGVVAAWRRGSEVLGIKVGHLAAGNLTISPVMYRCGHALIGRQKAGDGIRLLRSAAGRWPSARSARAALAPPERCAGTIRHAGDFAADYRVGGECRAPKAVATGYIAIMRCGGGAQAPRRCSLTGQPPPAAVHRR